MQILFYFYNFIKSRANKVLATFSLNVNLQKKTWNDEANIFFFFFFCLGCANLLRKTKVVCFVLWHFSQLFPHSTTRMRQWPPAGSIESQKAIEICKKPSRSWCMVHNKNWKGFNQFQNYGRTLHVGVCQSCIIYYEMHALSSISFCMHNSNFCK